MSCTFGVLKRTTKMAKWMNKVAFDRLNRAFLIFECIYVWQSSRNSSVFIIMPDFYRNGTRLRRLEFSISKQTFIVFRKYIFTNIVSLICRYVQKLWFVSWICGYYLVKNTLLWHISVIHWGHILANFGLQWTALKSCHNLVAFPPMPS